MRLPNAERAEVDMRKLTDYVLSTAHPRGRNKARVFSAALGINRTEAGVLRDWLLDVAANSEDATETTADEHGQRFEIRADMHYVGHSARVVSAWIPHWRGLPPPSDGVRGVINEPREAARSSRAAS